MSLSLLLGAALVAPTPIVNCVEIKEDRSRLRCYDTERGRVPDPEIAEKGQMPQTPNDPKAASPEELEDPKIRFRIRNDASPFPGPNASFGTKAATLTFGRDSSENYALANVAAIAIFDPPSDYGWQPFLVGQWKRSEDSQKRSDVRIFGAGIGTYLAPKNPDGLGANFWPVLMRRKDIYQNIDSDVAALQVDLVKGTWFSEDLDSDTENAYAFTPYVGVVFEERDTSGSDDGHWSSAYVGAEWSARLSRVTPRLLLTLKYTYFDDWSAPSSGLEREDDFASAGISYEFSDPADKTIKIRPSISLTREVGINPLIGPTEFNETKLSFGLTVDTY